MRIVLSRRKIRKARRHQFRGYGAWRFVDPPVTVILCGIGSGSLEPLLFEVLDREKLGERVPKRLVMIGTAAIASESGLEDDFSNCLGGIYVVKAAYTVGCAVALDRPVEPSRSLLEALRLPQVEEISTDYYYSATPNDDDPRKRKAKKMNPSLRAGLRKHWKRGRLVSMESAQFYHFATVYGSEDTQYVAIRGAVNVTDRPQTQADYSLQVLTDAFARAVDLLAG